MGDYPAMAESSFTVQYGGPALDAHVMPIRELAPAMLALGELFTDASKLLFPDFAKETPISLNVRAHKEGSFGIDLLLLGLGFWDQSVVLLNSPAVNALANLEQLLVGRRGLVALLKALRGQKPIEVITQAPGEIVYETDGMKLSFPPEVLTLHNNLTIRREIEAVVDPLRERGIETVTFKTASDPEPVVVAKDDLPGFVLSDDEEELGEPQEVKRFYEIVSLTFVEGNKWQFRESSGGPTFYAAIEDIDFVNAVLRGMETFASGDLLECIVLEQQVRSTKKGLQLRRRIQEVIRHERSGAQLQVACSGPRQ